MPFSNEENALIKNLHQFKEYGSWTGGYIGRMFKDKLEPERTGLIAEKKI